MNSRWIHKARAGRVAALAVQARRRRLLRQTDRGGDSVSRHSKDAPRAPLPDRDQALRLISETNR